MTTPDSQPSFWSNIQEKLILWQLEGETELFSYLNLLRLKLKQTKKDLSIIGKDEAFYFNFYKGCFMLETTALILVLPVGYFGHTFYKEWRKPKADGKILQKGLIRLMISGIPAFNLFLFNTYRRYIHTIPCERQLIIKYNQEIREIKRRKRELKS